MRIHLFRQPIFFIARRLIHPMLTRSTMPNEQCIGIRKFDMNAYNRIWNIKANVSLTSCLFYSFYLSLQSKMFLLEIITLNNINTLINRYNIFANNSSIVNLLFRVNSIGSNVPFLDPNVDTINNVLDTLVNSNHSLLIINSPLENSPLFDLLHSTMIMNVCSMVLLLTLFTTFLQILAVVRSFNLDFIDRLHFLKGLRGPIKRIILKWQNLSSKSLFIYFFVWWLLLYASAYYTVDHLQFILDNLDSMIDQHIEFKK